MCRQGFIEVGGGCVAASDAVCRDSYGASTFFDGGNECTCGVGRMYLKGKCVELSDAVCAAHLSRGAAGAPAGGAEFDGVDSCQCKQGFVLDLSAGLGEGVCVPGSDSVCQQQMGAAAEFDGARACRCRVGHVLVDGQCSRATPELCAGLLGPHSRFDALRSCACEPGYMSHVTGACAPGSDRACAQAYILKSTLSRAFLVLIY